MVAGELHSLPMKLKGYIWNNIVGSGKILMSMILEDFRCKLCGSNNIVRYGRYKDKQYWWCKSCKKKFTANDALPNMSTPIDQIASALSMFYEGMSLNAIRRNLKQTYESSISKTAIYNWITRFTKEAIAVTKDYVPDVGHVWIADETVLRIGGQKVWFWDILDIKTRFLLASHMSTSRMTKDAKILVERAARRAGKTPKVIITDKLQAYIDGIELAFGRDTKHIQAKDFTKKPNTNLIERFHGSVKARTKVMRGLKKCETAKLVMDGWLVFYNYIRPHESLSTRFGEKTPAEKAGIKFPYKNWLDIVRGGNGQTASNATKAEPIFMEVDRQGNIKRRYKQTHKRVQFQPQVSMVTGIR
jgi:putative transposase